jgi:hypothetical protein
MTVRPVAALRCPPRALGGPAMLRGGQLLMTVPPVAALRCPPRALRRSAEGSSS